MSTLKILKKSNNQKKILIRVNYFIILIHISLCFFFVCCFKNFCVFCMLCSSSWRLIYNLLILLLTCMCVCMCVWVFCLLILFVLFSLQLKVKLAFFLLYYRIIIICCVSFFVTQTNAAMVIIAIIFYLKLCHTDNCFFSTFLSFYFMLMVLWKHKIMLETAMWYQQL